jgi:hypothetical protein
MAVAARFGDRAGRWLVNALGIVVVSVGVVAMLFGPPAAACALVTAVVGLAPLAWRRMGRRHREGVWVAEGFAVVVGTGGVLAIFGPPWRGLDALVLAGAALVASMVTRARSMTAAEPRRSAVLAVGVLALVLPLEWMVDRAQTAADQWWATAREVPVLSEGAWDRCQGSLAREVGCTYVVDRDECVAVEPDAPKATGADAPTCPVLEARRVGSSGALVATRAVAIGEKGLHLPPDEPHLVAAGRFQLASAARVGATAAPWAWRAMAALGLLGCMVAGFAIHRRKESAPPSYPYRTAADGGPSSAKDDAPWRHVRLVAVLVALPILAALGAGLLRGSLVPEGNPQAQSVLSTGPATSP